MSDDIIPHEKDKVKDNLIKEKVIKKEKLKSALKTDQAISKCYRLIKNGNDLQFIKEQIDALSPDFDFESPLDAKGNTLMTLAANTGAWEVMAYLMKYGASPNSQDGEGNTPLHIAFMRDQ